MEFSVCPCKGKTFQSVGTLHCKPLSDIGKEQAYAVSLNLISFQLRALSIDFVSVFVCQSMQGKPSADLLLVLRMNILCLTYVDQHSQPCSSDSLGRHHLSLTKFSPIRFSRHSLSVLEIGKLSNMEREIAPPRLSPVAYHKRKKFTVLICPVDVGTALIPYSAFDCKRNQRIYHRIIQQSRSVGIA